MPQMVTDVSLDEVAYLAPLLVDYRFSDKLSGRLPAQPVTEAAAKATASNLFHRFHFFIKNLQDQLMHRWISGP